MFYEIDDDIEIETNGKTAICVIFVDSMRPSINPQDQIESNGR